MSDSDSILRELSQLLAERKRTRPADSYTTKLLDAGLPKIAAKITEEAAEVIEAAGEPHARRPSSFTTSNASGAWSAANLDQSSNGHAPSSTATISTGARTI